MTIPEPRSIRLDALAYGGDYNPDQWPEEVWAEDVRLMVEAGVNIVTLPVFSWPLLEPEPGRWDFAGLDRIIDLLWASGITIDLATATATPPAWLVREHPEVLPWNADGVRLEFGSRQSYCPSSPVFRQAALRLTRALAERYGEHPALALWHVSNEYGDHVARCWCPESARHFRRWLEARYGDIAGLNEAWGTSCWGQHYLSFDQIEPPRTATGPINPAHVVDFERFSSDALLELFTAEVDVLREVTPEIAVTTNFMSLFRELDYWDFADAEDLVTDDAYPDPADPHAHVAAALNYGLMRSLKDGRPWLLLEQAPSAVSWRDVNVPKAPGQLRLGSLQAVAHGSDGVMFFQWRQAKFGPEKFHSAILGHRGERSRSYRESKALGAELKRLEAVRGTRVRSSVALVADWDAWWGVTQTESMPSQRLDWLIEARAWHAAAFALGQPVDVSRASGPFGDHRVVLVPNLYAATAEQAEALSAFVAAGGHVVVGPFSGVVDHREQVHAGGAPGPLRDLLGVEVDEWWPLADGAHRAVELGGVLHSTRVWGEWIEAAPGTDVLARFADGDLVGLPALTRRAHGDGAAWYLAAGLDDAGMRAVLTDVFTAAGVEFGEPDTSLEVVTRTDGVTDFTFVLNHGREARVAPRIPGGTDLLTGADAGAGLPLGAFGVAVIEHPTV
ncbi:beta-galactosidase [Leifsonia sp. Leaf336]|uniref:beta-galactosidase n=1 Tax=Leifsonia sp. Leaf336 TaxID=1736341 RepID=UPI0006FBB39F|nr:beta-galactosidase [Leifsonia sp. Leaf336]KQR51193.1 beta-galactosidase [Leifsonia sp. Leaf336]